MAAAAVVLPQAIAFGVALLLPFGFNPSAGAIAGLIGAVALGFVSGISGGTLGLISSPTGPVLILLGGALASLVNAGLAL
ncbi:MAG: SulP family inorganic anion transporter [Gammaproteobacteria bacterium]|nr:SulP family inorganic anion transporter [Gammaproteobacteria bacterium]